MLILVRGGLLLVVQFALFQEVGVVARVAGELLLGDLVNVFDHLIHELPVVRDHE